MTNGVVAKGGTSKLLADDDMLTERRPTDFRSVVVQSQCNLRSVSFTAVRASLNLLALDRRSWFQGFNGTRSKALHCLEGFGAGRSGFGFGGLPLFWPRTGCGAGVGSDTLLLFYE